MNAGKFSRRQMLEFAAVTGAADDGPSFIPAPLYRALSTPSDRKCLCTKEGYSDLFLLLQRSKGDGMVDSQ